LQHDRPGIYGFAEEAVWEGNPMSIPSKQAGDSLAIRFDPAEVRQTIDQWLVVFCSNVTTLIGWLKLKTSLCLRYDDPFLVGRCGLPLRDRLMMPEWQVFGAATDR